uniref:ATP synthase F0 subunit 8 n=1 Tax=Chortoglyphus arcuatus TaxID=66564 RepID=UPI0022008693|nr:ATP synthase F0 subunit 8 [Chortoglyphus arcuatus]UBQ34125.1 ATP synthase F0 subunit 8 [Chortoglyphus arcuatus]
MLPQMMPLPWIFIFIFIFFCFFSVSFFVSSYYVSFSSPNKIFKSVSNNLPW